MFPNELEVNRADLEVNRALPSDSDRLPRTIRFSIESPNTGIFGSGGEDLRS